MRPNLQSNIFGLKVRTRGSQPSICVPTFSLFTISQEELAWNRARLEGNYKQEQPVVNITAGGILLFAFLELLNCLSNNAGSGIEGLEIETPQS
jgi:hypothetical protein